MIIVYILFIFFTINLIRNFNKWFIITLSLSTWLSQFTFINQKLFTYLLLVIIIIAGKNNFFNKKDFKTFPLKWACIFIAFSLLITNFSVDIANRHTPITLFIIAQNTITLYIFWKIFNENPLQTTKIFTKTNLTFGLILSLYCIYEGLTKTNPYLDFMTSLNIYNSKFYDEVRFGIKRVQGFFSIYTTIAGIALNLISLGIAYLRNKNTTYNKILIALLFTMLFFSGMRSAIICMFICLLTFINPKEFTIKKILSIIFSILVIGIIFKDYFIEFINAIIHTDKVQGSTEDLRWTQLSVSIIGFQQSPIWGNGINYTFTDLIYDYPELAGADSIWMSLMIDQGLIGILSYIIFFVSCLHFIFQHNKKVSFYLLGTLLSQTIASITSFPIVYIFPYIVIITYLLQKEQKPKNQIIR